MSADISVIKSEAQYRDYLGAIEVLMAKDPAPESEDGRKLELLALLVETYEKERFPIAQPEPVEAILFRLEQQGLQQKDLVPILGTKSRVSEVLSGKRKLTIPMMRRLSAQLSIPIQVLVGSDESARDAGNESPVGLAREIIRRGWASSARVSAKNARDFIQRMINSAGSDQIALAHLRGSLPFGSLMESETTAIRLWIARVLVRSRDSVTRRGAFRAESIDLTILSELAKLSWFENGPALAIEYLSKLGIAVVVERQLPGGRIDGAATLDIDGTPVIGLTLRRDRLDIFWFTLLHECVHVIRHLSKNRDVFVDDVTEMNELDPYEVEADKLARDALIPLAIWRESEARRVRTPSAVRELSEQLRIHPAIIAGRIQRETGNYRQLASMVGQGEVGRALSERSASPA
ncbi:MAG: hypothetical protein BroJett031_03080 [Betaproteobacteria bacterium]|nr:MAG: hypothetical protein BroJett031_03080 [Betaproteobacteria bacterium]